MRRRRSTLLSAAFVFLGDDRPRRSGVSGLAQLHSQKLYRYMCIYIFSSTHAQNLGRGMRIKNDAQSTNSDAQSVLSGVGAGPGFWPTPHTNCTFQSTNHGPAIIQGRHSRTKTAPINDGPAIFQGRHSRAMVSRADTQPISPRGPRNKRIFAHTGQLQKGQVVRNSSELLNQSLCMNSRASSQSEVP